MSIFRFDVPFKGSKMTGESSGNYVPIGQANERGNKGIRVNYCDEHGGNPDHVDMVVPLPELGDAHKIRVDADGTIISDNQS